MRKGIMGVLLVLLLAACGNESAKMGSAPVENATATFKVIAHPNGELSPVLGIPSNVRFTELSPQDPRCSLWSNLDQCLAIDLTANSNGKIAGYGTIGGLVTHGEYGSLEIPVVNGRYGRGTFYQGSKSWPVVVGKVELSRIHGIGSPTSGIVAVLYLTSIPAIN